MPTPDQVDIIFKFCPRMASREVWHFEKVSIKDSEYAKKCGLKGDCYFWVSKGLIKIEQLDRKTSFQITVSHIR